MALSSAAVSDSSLSRERDNFLRLSTLLIDGGTKLLRDVFNHILLPATVTEVLAKPETKLKLKTVRLFDKERKLLNPPGGGTVTTDDFDITLLCKLLTNICNLIPPSSGSWKNVVPDPAHKRPADDLVRIRIYRNEAYAHVKELKLESCEFERIWKEISSAMIRLAGNISSAKETEWTSFISQCYSSAITSREQEFVKELEEWYDNDKCLKEEVEKLEEVVVSGFNDLKTVTETSFEKMDVVIDRMEAAHQGIFQKLEDLEFVATLQGERKIEYQLLKKRLGDFREDIMPGQLLSYLPCLTTEVKERISSIESDKKPEEAVEILVESVARQENGFVQFVRALRKTGNGHVALLLDPHQEIELKDKDDETDRKDGNVCRIISGTAIDVQIKGAFYEKVTEEGASAVTDTADAEKYSELEDEITEKYSDLRSIQSQELRKKLKEFLPPGVEFVHTVKGSVICVFRVSSLTGAKKLWEIYENGSLELKLKELLLECSFKHKIEAKDLFYKVTFPVDRHRQVCKILKDIEMEKGLKSAPQPISEVSQGVEVTEAKNEPFEFKIHPVYLGSKNSKLELREYQKELAKEALRGENTIICAPTNSGKTYVAIHIVKEHLQASQEDTVLQKSPKVVFIVSTVALISQQRKRFELYIKEPYQVGDISGGKKIHMSLKDLLKNRDIVIMTAQILVDALNDKENGVAMTDISLLIFDECHHTQKDHPYKKIMEQYLDLKLRSGTRNQLPQVVGLTASLGTGNANSIAKAVEHILQVCGNLDAECVSTVRDNIEELSETVSNLDRQVFIVPKRDSDKFEEVITQIMKTIEQEMGPVNPMPPPDRSSQNYRNWLEGQDKQAATENNKRDFLTYIEQLRKYHVALEINRFSRMRDALGSLEKHSGAQNEETTTAVDRELNNRYDKAKAVLKEYFDTHGEPQNPKLLKLQQLLIEYTKKSKDTSVQSTSKGIVFTTTRESTQALLNWIKDTKEFEDVLRPLTIVGSGDSAIGMTSTQQNDAIERFKSGEFNVLLATNVAEEGLDISDCDFVIRYDVMGNEISSVQSRGRVRAKEGKYITLAGAESGVSKREERNSYRELLMVDAVGRVQAMDPEDFKKKVHHLQMKDSEHRNSKRAESKKRKYEFQPFDVNFICRRCKTSACQGNHIKMIGTHYVVIAADFEEKVRFKPHPKKDKEISGVSYKEKVHCRICDHDWGVKVEINGIEYISIKVVGFTLEYSDDSRQAPKKWRDVRFLVSELTSGE